jgi:cell division protein FtsI (penicillin-binding protein 3)
MHARAKIQESGWQRALRSVLYGRDVDRNVKAKARLGLAIVAFVGIFSVITFRGMFATVNEGTGGAAASRRTRLQLRAPTFSTVMARSSRRT